MDTHSGTYPYTITNQLTHLPGAHGMTYRHTMPRDKIAITLERRVLQRLDRLVRTKAFASRSHAIQQAVAEKLERLDPTRLARECAKLDPKSEATLADETLPTDRATWPEY